MDVEAGLAEPLEDGVTMGRDGSNRRGARMWATAVAVTLLAGLMPSAAAAQDFTLELVDELVPGRPGEVVGTMFGSGCPHGQPPESEPSPSSVFVGVPSSFPGGLVVAVAFPDVEGDFGETDLVVPDEATPGSYELDAWCRDPSDVGFAPVGLLEVLPPLEAPDSVTGTLTPDRVVAEPGQELTFTAPVEGTMDGPPDAFLPGQEITLVRYPGAVVVGSDTAPTEFPGTFDLEVAAPQAVGSYQVVAFGRLEQPALIGAMGQTFVADIEVRTDAEPPDAPDVPPFSDVHPDDVHAPAILRLAALDVLLGYPDGTFRPSQDLGRGQMASVVARALGLDPVDDGPFPDVDPAGTHAGAINALAAAGIVEGRPDGTFDVHGGVTRGQLASVLARAAGLPDGDPDAFEDIAGSPHAGAIAALAAAGVVEGYPDGTFRPGVVVTRAQAATFVVGLLGLLGEG